MDEADDSDDRTWNAAQQLLWLMPLLGQGIGNEMRAAGEEHGIVTMSQIRAMWHLRDLRALGQSCSLNDLAQSHEVSPATMSRMISTLVERDWVHRETDPSDRRQVTLSLTSDGERIGAEIVNRSVGYLADTLAALTDEELTGLEQTLTALRRAAGERHTQARCHRDEKSSRIL